MPPANHIGDSPRKVDALDKATGRAQYADDLAKPGDLELFLLRSKVPHADLSDIDTSRAKQAPGVVGVWTAADLPGASTVGPRIKDEPVLVGDKVRRVGDPLALVAAETRHQAEAAAGLIKVSLQELEPVLNPEAALSPESPLVHEGGNLLFERRVIKGDAEAALDIAAHVITNTYRTQMVEHAYLEPEAGRAYWENGTLVVTLPTKHAHFEQQELARVLGMEPRRIRVICTTIGGYFGDKQCLSPGYYAALAAYLTGRPTHMAYSRSESFQVSTKRHPFTVEMTTGADAKGRLLAVKVEILADTGAYASYGPSVLTRAVVHATGPYEVPNVQVRGRLVYTNNPVGGAMRGFGVPQVALAHETQMDLLARAVGVSPEQIRRVNFLTLGKANAAGQALDASVGLDQCLQKVSEAKGKMPPHPREKDPAWATGWGIAATHYGIGLTGLPNPGTAWAGLAPGEKKVTISVGTGDGGQGAFTTLVQIAAQELGLELDQVVLVTADTARTPNSGTSTASRISYVVGRSVQEACRELARQLALKVAQAWGVQEVEFVGGIFRNGERSMDLFQAARQVLSEPLSVEGSFDPPTQQLDPETGQGKPYATYSFAVQAAQVAVDLMTGKVDVLRVLAAHDVGRVIHPVNLTAQIQGAVVMGLGYALFEEIRTDRGCVINDGFTNYHIATAQDCPQVEIFPVESPEPTGPFGAKGVAEPALLSTAPAIHNAVAAAIGEHLFEIPLSPERIWRKLRSKLGQERNRTARS